MYSIRTKNKKKPLSLDLNKEGLFILVPNDRLLATYKCKKTAFVISVILGNGDGTAISPLLSPKAGQVELCYINEEARNNTSAPKKLAFEAEDNIKLVDIDDIINLAITPSSKLTPMYAKKLTREDLSSMNGDTRVIKTPKNQNLNIKIGDTLIAYSHYSNFLCTEDTYIVIDDVDTDKLCENRKTCLDTFDYHIGMKIDPINHNLIR